MPKLSVNVDHVATVREARKNRDPDPVVAAAVAELAGADGITIHIREDRRHIQERDLRILRETVKGRLNLEMAATQEMLKIALYVKPDLATLVPEKREELTTEGGLEVSLHLENFKKYIRHLHDGNIKVSLFIDPDLDQVKASHRAGTDIIEINTGRYSEARSDADQDREYEKILNAVKTGAKLGLAVSAGHGLNYLNVKRIARIAEIEDLNIGHSIVARAVISGFDRAVREMNELVKTGLV